MVAESLEVPKKSIYPQLYYPHASHFLRLSILSSANHPFYLFLIQGTRIALAERQPSIVPTLIANNRINVCTLLSVSRVRRKIKLSISFGNEFTLIIKSFDCDDEFWPSLYIHTGNKEVETQTNSYFSVMRLAEIWLSLCILFYYLFTSVSGV